MVNRQLTIAVAESVTSGHLQAALSLAEDARQFFQGGMTVYNLGQKARHLHIEPIHALGCDCVSEIISGQMAQNIAKMFSSDFGIGVTGYAAPVPEKGIKTPFAYYSISLHEKIVLRKKIEAQIEPELEVQLYYTRVILESLESITH